MIELLLLYANKDQKKAQRMINLLKADRSLKVTTYEEIGPGANTKKEKEKINNRAQVVLFLLSADFLANQTTLEDGQRILYQRSDLFQRHLVFSLVIRSLVRNSFQINVLRDGKVTAKEEEMVEAIQELYQKISSPESHVFLE